ncbi:MASE1 domain-containing protein [Leptolyngbya sp. GGD]|uniref:MASE1 domain-containing protein n=1 Tax=Leptolyngbya sp. GGD TaxID=2997907 RepID=UPI00227AC0FF|nr:MASE1 domain-containing protein [Leptolyngbya sp. GGD]MCY6490056.1 MASE1 domain-containing protein [Leptolyngbya sp. GGD]
MNSIAAPKPSAFIYRLVGTALVYYITAKLGQYLAIPPGFITPVYAPSGIAVAVLLCWGDQLAVGIWIAALIAAAWPLWVNTGNGAMSMVSGLGIATGSVLQALVGAWLLRRWVGADLLFQKAQNVFKFAGIELFSCMISPTLGAGTMLLCGLISPNNFLNSWITFWLGDYIGVLVIAPLLILMWLDRIATWQWLGQTFKSAQKNALDIASIARLLVHPDHSPETSRQFKQLREVGIWLVLISIVGIIAFGMAYPIEYMVVPLLVWAALRFGQRFTNYSILLVAGLALAGTIHGTSSFNRSTLNETLLLLQAFIGAITLMMLVLSAVIIEREQAKTSLEQANADLESKIEARTAELQLAKHYLEEQVQERTASLSQALAELTHTHESLKQAQLQLVQTEKMSSLGQLVAGVAHEINNPIGFIFGNITYTTAYTQDLLDLLELYQTTYDQPTPAIQAKLEEVDLEFLKADLPKTFSSMRAGADRVKQIVLSLRNFSRLDEAAFKPANIHEGIDNALVILDHQLKATNHRSAIQVVKTYGQIPLIECYVGQLNQVFMNILVNAIEAIAPDKQATRTNTSCHALAARTDRPGTKLFDILQTYSVPTIHIDTELQEQSVVIRIADNGPGMTEETLKNIFNPFFTTKPVGQGTGLGLSISYQIITERHQGTLQCHSVLDYGTEFIIQIPR